VVSENSGDKVIVRCSGRLVAGKAAWALYDTVTSQQNKRVVLLDLTGVNRVDARGVGVLAFLKKWANEAGARMELIPSRPVLELLELAGLSYEFELRSSEIATAMRSAQGKRSAGYCAGGTRPAAPASDSNAMAMTVP